MAMIVEEILFCITDSSIITHSTSRNAFIEAIMFVTLLPMIFLTFSRAVNGKLTLGASLSIAIG